MKALLCLACFVFVLSGGMAAESITTPATLIKPAKLTLKKGTVNLPAGTRIEIIERNANTLTVRYRALVGEVPATDTDHPDYPDEPQSVSSSASAPAPTPVVTAKPVVKPKDAPKPTPPALNTNPLDAQPTTNYGKMVQKAKINANAHKDALVDPASEVLDAQEKTAK